MIWLIIALLITVADQVTKYIVATGMTVGETAASLVLFDITYVRNEGAAFSMLSGRMSLLSIISVAFCIAVIIWWLKKKPTHPMLCTSATLLFAGALGNAIDRIARGYVVDFIRTTFIDFPIFNVADIAITVGAMLLILYEIAFNKEDKHEDNNSEADGGTHRRTP